MPFSGDRYAEILDALYEGLLDESSWSDALRQINAAFSGSALALFSTDPKSGKVFRADVVGADTSVMNAYGGHWIQHDPRHHAGLGKPAGTIYTEDMLVDWRRFIASPIYNEFLLPAEIPRHMATWLAREPHRGVVLSIQGTNRRGPFDSRERNMMSRIATHVRRIVELQDRIHLAGVSHAGIAEHMNRLPFGVLLLDAQLNIIEASSAAATMLSRGGPLTCRSGTLAFRRAADRTAFHACLAEDPTRPGRSDGVVIARGPGHGSIRLLPLPVPPSRGCWLVAGCSWIVLMFGPQTSAPQPTALRAMLGITAAEARLVEQLVGGLSVSEAADLLGISVHTARSQLKSVFGRTGIRRQADLIRHVLTH